jgi:hypothetical protein
MREERPMLRRLAAVATAAMLGACTVIGVRAGTEEPTYSVVGRQGEVEIRRYGPRLVAETLIEGGTEEAARSEGFRRLAGYIFGGNQPAAKIAMTAPVEQVAPPRTAPTRIAMTAPVSSARVSQAPSAAGDAWRIRFFMPAAWTRETLPVPNDPLVGIVEVPGETVAVLRFSGVPSAAAVAEQGARLLQALEAGPWAPKGAVTGWFYDPPWTLPPLRRNEVAVPVEPRSPAGTIPPR